HVRELMDEIFGADNRLGQISFLRGGSQTTGKGLPVTADYLLWYARDYSLSRARTLLVADGGWAARSQDLWVETSGGERRRATAEDETRTDVRFFTHRSLESARETGSDLNKFEIQF